MTTVHAPHPRCEGCRRALYKAMEIGTKVSVSDPYQYCRNTTCPQYGYRESEPEPETTTDVETAPEPPVERAVTRRHRSRVARDPQEGLATEPPEVARARANFKRVVEEMERSGGSPASIGLTLALLNQATGNHDAANVLIEKHQLHRFGIHKQMGGDTPGD